MGAGVTQTEDGAIDLAGRRLSHALHGGVQIDYQGGTNPIYVGWAEPGTPTSAAKWRIAKLTYDIAGNPTQIQWLRGTLSYDFIWDNHATDPTYIYS